MDNLVFGMEYINITQLPGGDYSHPNKAVDLGGKDTGIDLWMARGDTYWKCTCCWYVGSNTYHFLSCDSKGNQVKVHCADGVDRVVTVSLTHSNKAPIVGRLYHNEKMFEEGTKYPTAGVVTGNHIHLEIANGDVRTRYQKKYGNTTKWTLPNELNPIEVMFVDDSFSKVLNTKGANLKHVSNVRGGDKMAVKLNDGFSKVGFKNILMNVFKGYGDIKQMYALSAKGDYASRQTIDKFDHSNMYIYAVVNGGYFDMGNGQHYGVEQTDGDNVHTSSLDLAPKNASYQVAFQLKDGTVAHCTADKYFYSKDDVLWAITPYSIVVDESKSCNYRTSAYGNKEGTANTQTMAMFVDGAWVLVTTAAKTLPNVMQSFALECGAEFAMLLDSGGSTQMYAFYDGAWNKVINTGRAIANALVIGKFKDKQEEAKPTPEPQPEETVSKEEYDKLKSELDALKNDYVVLGDKADSYEEKLKQINELSKL